MRIQHNIMAMNAYRNYNTNTSALSKNLEKLSSGYKINRAGDDAAGLAISEKMRAQITGLNAATKNVKDGVSLVKTAEGAMQEIHDMLGRMKYLATQSANGTYKDEVDRENLQKEVDSLRTEINRIADSANFNGQKLLNGELDVNARNGNFAVENVQLHTDKPAGTTGTTFAVDFGNFQFKRETAAASQSATVTLTLGSGKNAIKIEMMGKFSKTAGTFTAENMIDALVGANTPSATKVKITVGSDVIAKSKIKAGSWDLGDYGAFTVKKGTDTSQLVFEQKKSPTTEKGVFNGDMDVKLECTGAAFANKTGKVTIEGDYLNRTTNVKNIGVADKDLLAKAEITLTNAMITVGSSITIGKETYTFVKEGSGANKAAKGNEVVIGDLNPKSDDFLSKVANRLSVAASGKNEAGKANAVWEVSADTTVPGRISLLEKTHNQSTTTNVELDTFEKIMESVSFDTKAKPEKALQLQIGDSADEFNRLAVGINDMHAVALGIDKINIGTAASAKDAIKSIENAINTVSSTRGDLGAIQNRLEHTEKNLSVMTENIQDAEANIRDTDVANEMMAYTKNNILIQSAQAMLAQANQVPQGVLQLLQ